MMHLKAHALIVLMKIYWKFSLWCRSKICHCIWEYGEVWQEQTAQEHFKLLFSLTQTELLLCSLAPSNQLVGGMRFHTLTNKP